MSPLRVRLAGTAALLLIAGLTPGQAHEFWLEPHAWQVEPGATISLRLRVGDGPPGEPYSRNPGHLVRFELLGPDGARFVSGRPGNDPAGRVGVDGGPGTRVAVYEGGSSRAELEASEFESYLRSVGLEQVIEKRAALGESAMPGRERFSRCAKTLIRVGDAEGGFDRVAGLDLEIVPRDDPRTARARGGKLSVQVLREGSPAPGLLVRAFHPDLGAAASARTDAAGRGSLPLDRPGFWLLSVVDMRREESESDLEWSSVWSSLSVMVP